MPEPVIVAAARTPIGRAGKGSLVEMRPDDLAAIAVGALCGVLGALLGEACARAFLVHGDTHVDPPALAIALMTTAIVLTDLAL